MNVTDGLSGPGMAGAERMRWVDAMRGFSMILVVLAHVLNCMDIGGTKSFLGTLFISFRMPLFFFVSGYFSYRALNRWTKVRLTDILKRKFKAQILCTAIFFLIYRMVMDKHIFWIKGIGGYWFTIVLFQMFITYILAMLISKAVKRDIVVPILAVLSLATLASITYLPDSLIIQKYLCLDKLFRYMQFFTWGIVCSKYREVFFKTLQNNIFITTAIVGWVVCLLLYYNKPFATNLPDLHDLVHKILIRYFALISVVCVFFSNRSYFQQDTRCSRWMCFIGQRTLDIYMIHYFFLPDLKFMHSWIAGNSMFIIQLIIAGTLSCIIVAASLVVSSVLRKSATLESWLFGVKRKPYKINRGIVGGI